MAGGVGDALSLWEGVKETGGRIIAAVREGAEFDPTDQIALSALGVALAAAALAPRLDVELKVAGGLAGAATQRVLQITNEFLFGGLMNLFAVIMGLWGAMAPMCRL